MIDRESKNWESGKTKGRHKEIARWSEQNEAEAVESMCHRVYDY